MTLIPRWTSKRRAINELCVQAIRTHRAIDSAHASVGNPGWNPEDACVSTHALVGRLNGIRIAICVLNDWIVDDDSYKGGPADQLIQAYWEKNYPATWAQRA